MLVKEVMGVTAAIGEMVVEEDGVVVLGSRGNGGRLLRRQRKGLDLQVLMQTLAMVVMVVKEAAVVLVVDLVVVVEVVDMVDMGVPAAAAAVAAAAEVAVRQSRWRW